MRHELTHLSLGCGDGGPAGVDLLVDGGEEVLGDAQGILQQREVGVVLGGVLQQVLKHTTSQSLRQHSNGSV